MTELPPPGWYADADDSRYQRWWDGRIWTETVRLAALPEQYLPVAAPPRPRNAPAVVSMVFGIVSAAVVALCVVGAYLDPFTALFLLAVGATAVATGIPGIVKARRYQPAKGRGPAITGLVLGGATVLLTIAGVTMVIVSLSSSGA